MADTSPNPALIALLVLLGPVFFLGLWFAVTSILARVGGWSKLAQHYRTFDEFGGVPYRFQFGYLGFVRYKGVLTFGADAKGMYLAVLVLFRPGHPPLLVPWGQLSVEASGSDRYALKFKAAPGVVLKITRRLGEQLLAGRRLLQEEPR
jgi:hypothetical protein